jgi:Protein of unknown function (DUF3995)
MFGSSPNRTARAAGVAAAFAACLLGVVYAGVSAYWGVGGTGLLDTIGGTLEREGRAGNAGLLAVVWISAVLKLMVAVLGVVAVVAPWRLRPRRHQLARRTAWAAALLLVLYGGVLTTVGVLVQAGVVGASSNADHKALRWHAYLWDPWFLLWGLLLAAALALSRAPRSKKPRRRLLRS